MANPNWELGIVAHKIESLFIASMEGNQQVLWVAMEGATGLSRRDGKLLGAVQTALRRMRKNYRVDFRSMRGVGYCAMADAEHATAAQHDIGRIGRIQRRRRKRMALADVTQLTADERLVHYGCEMLLDQIADASSPQAVKKVGAMMKRLHNMGIEEQQGHLETMRRLMTRKI
jgi:hypothetical protein